MSSLEKTFNSLGKLFKELRLKRGITQAELSSKTGYSVRQLSRLENDNTQITNEIIDTLSIFYNVDIQAYMSILNKFSNPNSYTSYINTRDIVENNNFDKLELEFSKLDNLSDFQTGELLQLKLYCRALISAMNYGDYTSSNSSCYNALDVFNYGDYITSLKVGALTEMSYPVLLLLSYNFSQLDEHELSHELSFELFQHFHNFIFSDYLPIKVDMYHMKKYYIASANNLAQSYFEQLNFEKALEHIDVAIKLSHAFKINLYSHYLFQLKFESLFHLNDLGESKKFLTLFEYTCEANGKTKYFNSVIDTLRLKYKLLFDDK